MSTATRSAAGVHAGVSTAFVILLGDRADAEGVAALLASLCGAGAPSVVAIPPLRGRAFFSDAAAQADLDVWWRERIPRQASPVYIVDAEAGLAPWLVGIDGVAYVGAGSDDVLAEYRSLGCARALLVTHPLDYVRAIVSASDPGSGVFDPDAAERVAHLAASLRTREASVTPDAAVHGGGSAAGGPDAGAPRPLTEPAPDPFDLLAAMNEPARPAPAVPSPRQQPADGERGRDRLRLPSLSLTLLRRIGLRPGNEDIDDAELAALLTATPSTIVAVGSRKGGVGKTSHAAGVAIAAGEVLDLMGHRAAIVDANIANPDAWGQLSLAAGAATVRDVIGALSSNREPPPAVHASTPALACYPESREASEYSQTEIARFASYLRQRYTFIVVDMSNRLPDPTGGAEAVAAAFWLQQADVVILPTASSKQDFNGVLDYLELAELPPAIVAQIVARTRRNRAHPLARRYQQAIAERADAVVELPDDAERVRYAVLEGVPVQQVSPRLRAGYRRLAAAVARIPRRSR